MNSTTIHVKNISSNIEKDQIHNIFIVFGNILQISRVASDRDAGFHITFEEEVDAENAIANMNGYEYCGATLVVVPASTSFSSNFHDSSI